MSTAFSQPVFWTANVRGGQARMTTYLIEDLCSLAQIDLELDCQTIERGAAGSLANLLRRTETTTINIWLCGLDPYGKNCGF